MNDPGQNLGAWLAHRSRLLSLSWPDGVADISGIPASMLNLIRETQTLRGVNRSARGYLARALKVSMRELEAISQGGIDWIADNRMIDFDRLTPSAARHVNRDRATSVVSSSRVGVPILGRILEDGQVENSEGWTPEDVPRVAIRYPGVPDAFALELLCDAESRPARKWLIFQTVSPGELADGELAILTTDETEFREVYPQDSMRVLTLPGNSMGRSSRVIDMCDILRAARVIDHIS